MGMISSVFESLRPDQWVKNAFVLIPLVFAEKLFDLRSVFESLMAVAVFCLLAGATYLINDLNDLKSDSLHPIKKQRPLASGRATIRAAKWAVALLLILCFMGGSLLGRDFLWILLIYLAVQTAYNLRLKDVVILDICCVSAGFFLRVIAGGAAINVPISNWLVICSISIAMFLTLGKRRSELTLLGRHVACLHRSVFNHYTYRLLDQMIGVVTAITLLSYMLYCISPQTVDKFHTEDLIYTFPFVLYGVFRYLLLVYRRQEGDSPSRVLMSDRPLLLSVVLWGVSCVLIIYGWI